MKKTLTLLLTITILMISCKSLELEETDTKDSKNQDELSYAMGVSVGINIKELDVEIDIPSFTAGLRASLLDNNATLTYEEAGKIINLALEEIQQQKTEENKKAGIEYLENNAKRKEVITTPSGLQYEVLQEGSGSTPGPTSKVTVHYTGTLIDGTVFDSSVTRGEKVTFGLNQVIPGWTEGIQLMNVGAIYKFYIPSDLAYGDQGAGQVIGPNETIIFEVELFAIE